MSDEEKCEAVFALMDLYGGWLDMSHALLGPEETGNPAWADYHTRAQERTAALSHIDDPLRRWSMAWAPAFWDTIQEKNYVGSRRDHEGNGRAEVSARAEANDGA